MATNPFNITTQTDTSNPFNLTSGGSSSSSFSFSGFGGMTPLIPSSQYSTPQITTGRDYVTPVLEAIPKVIDKILPGVPALVNAVESGDFNALSNFYKVNSPFVTNDDVKSGDISQIVKKTTALALSFSPIGEGQQLEKEVLDGIKSSFDSILNFFTKTEDKSAVKQVLTSLGHPLEGLDQTASRLVESKTVSEVKSVLNDVGGLKSEASLPRSPLQTPESVSPETIPQRASQSLGIKSSLPDTVALTEGDVKAQESVSQLVKALKEAKPIRAEQEAAYTKARAEKISNVELARKSGSGESGFYKELSQLKGSLPKVEFESLRGKISQDHIDTLFNLVRDSNRLDSFETIAARNGLVKMFQGAVPTNSEIKLLSQVMPKEVIQTLLEKRPLLTRIGDGVINALNVPRSIMSSFDLSAPFRQGIFMVGRKEFWKSFSTMFKQFGSERAFQAVQDEIFARKTFPLMKEAKLAIMDAGTLLSGREERFMSNWAEQIPGVGRVVRASDRAYTGFLNKLRADVFDDILKKATEAGVNVQGDFMPSLGKFINSATGRGSIGALDRTAEVLNSVMFSPRLMMSRINLLNPQYYASLNPTVRKEALKSLFTFTSLALTTLTLAKMGGASISPDPRNADFGKIKTGNTRIDILGGFQQYIRIAAQLLSGKIISSTTGKTLTLGEGYKPLTRLDIIERFFQGKENPIASFITDWLQGTDLVGNKFKLGPELLTRIVPMITQDAFDVFKDAGFAKGLGVTAAGVFGFGTQTYTGTSENKSSSGANPFNI